MTVSLWRAEENVPEKRRPSCLSMTSVKATARQPRLAHLLLGTTRRPTQHVESLSPQMPRRSGIAVSAAAAAARAISMTIQA